MRIQVTFEFDVPDDASLDTIEEELERRTVDVDEPQANGVVVKRRYSWLILDEHRRPVPMSLWPRYRSGYGIRSEFDDPGVESR